MSITQATSLYRDTVAYFARRKKKNKQEKKIKSGGISLFYYDLVNFQRSSHGIITISTAKSSIAEVIL